MKHSALIGLALSLLSLQALTAQVTFNEHIAPIIYNNCTVCHREGEIGPMSLTNYAEISAYAQSIDTVIHDGTMPPWPPDRSFSRLIGERGLTDAQKELIRDWIDEGLPEGDAALATPLPDFPKGSVLGEPDLTLTMAEAFEIRGNGKDEYRVFVLPTGLTEDKDIIAVEFRPGNAQIVHHALLSTDTSGEARTLEAEDSRPGYASFGGFGVPSRQGLAFPGWVPGTTPRFFPPGVGLKLEAGSDILLQIHYAPWPAIESDQSSINLFFADKPVDRYIGARLMLPSDLVDENDEYFKLPPTNPLTAAIAAAVIASGVDTFLGESVSIGEALSLGNNATLDTVFGDEIGGTAAGFQKFEIPGNTSRTFRGKWEIKKDISLFSIWPHMHYLGSDWEITLERPDGTTENLIRINQWDFNWQGNYSFTNYIKAPKGSTVFASASYDNRTTNPANPSNPPKKVNWGEKTTDEMFYLPFAFVDYQPGDEDISLESLAPGDLPTFRLANLTKNSIEFQIQNQSNTYVIEHSADMHLWQRVTTTETSRNDDWRTITMPRTEDSAGFYRAVIYP